MEQLTLIKTREVRHDPPCEGAAFTTVAEGFQLQYKHPNGFLYQGNSIEWLSSLDDASVDLVFADPPYNIKKADWDSFESQEKYIAWSMQWIAQASRVLKPTGSLVCVRFFGDTRRLETSCIEVFQALPLAGLALQEQGQPGQRLGAFAREHHSPAQI